MNDEYVDAGEWFRSRNGGRELTFAQSLKAFRECDELSLIACAKLVGVSVGQLCDFESGREIPSSDLAKQIGERMGYGDVFISAAVQDALDRKVPMNEKTRTVCFEGGQAKRLVWLARKSMFLANCYMFLVGPWWCKKGMLKNLFKEQEPALHEVRIKVSYTDKDGNELDEAAYSRSCADSRKPE